MHIARPAVIVSLFLAAVTLWYTGQWAGKDPRAMDRQSVPVVTADDTDHALAKR